MKTQTRTLIKSAMAIAIGAAFVAPAAFAQDIGGKVGARVTGAAQAQVPDPVPAADRALEQSSTMAQERMEQTTDATQTAQDTVDAQAEQAMETAQEAQEDTTAQTEQTMEEAEDTADDVDEATADAMQDAPPEQSQGAANAAAHSEVVERELFGRLDVDGDGMISDTEAEADAEFDGSFSAIDSDGDGLVTSAEYDAYARANLSTGGQNAADQSQAAVTTLWANFDADTDGRLSAAEVEADAGLSSSFEAIDDDGDGFVTQDEYRAYARANAQPEDPTP